VSLIITLLGTCLLIATIGTHLTQHFSWHFAVSVNWHEKYRKADGFKLLPVHYYKENLIQDFRGRFLCILKIACCNYVPSPLFLVYGASPVLRLLLKVLVRAYQDCGLGSEGRSEASLTTVVLLSASEHRHEMSAATSTVYNYVKGHYPTSKEDRGAREHQVDTTGVQYHSEWRSRPVRSEK
jgi:hypothetical protein